MLHNRRCSNTFMQTLNFILADGTPVTQSITLKPLTYPVPNNLGGLATGDIISASVTPVTLNLVDTTWDLQCNLESDNDWFFSTSGSQLSLISGSTLSSSYSTVTINNLTDGNNLLLPHTDIYFSPLYKNVMLQSGSNNYFVMGDTFKHTTDASASLTLNLLPLPYKMEYIGRSKNTCDKILPSGSTCNITDIGIQGVKISKIITPTNQNLYGYTAQAADARFLSISGTVTSASYALSASYVPNLYPTNLTGYTLTSSFNNYTSSNDAKVNSLINHTSSYLTTSSVISSSISASYSPQQLPDITDDTVNHRIGIHNTSPSYALDVNGDINLSGDINYNGQPLIILGSTLYDVANGVQSITFNDDHLLMDRNGIPNLDFGNSGIDVYGNLNLSGSLLQYGSTYIPNNAVSASYAPFPTDIDNYVTTSSFNNYTSSNDAKVSGLLNATSSYVTNSKTSSMTVATASYVKLSVSASYITSSNIVGTVNSSSYSATSSYLIGYVAPTLVSSSISSSWVSASVFITTAQTASYITASNVAGLTTTLINSSSYALSSSYAPLILPSQISITGITASLSGTSSWSNNSISASYITASNISGIVNSSSYATSSSYSSGSVIGSGITNVVSITSASYAALGTPNPTTLYIVNDISQPYSASYSINASTSSYSNGVKSNFTLQTNNYQIQPTDCCIIMSGSTTLSASLPSSLSVGSQYSIKNGGSANCILTSSVVIDNSNSWTINPLSSITVVSSTTQYYII